MTHSASTQTPSPSSQVIIHALQHISQLQVDGEHDGKTMSLSFSRVRARCVRTRRMSSRAVSSPRYLAHTEASASICVALRVAHRSAWRHIHV